MALTNKQLVFVHEYLRDFNATQAAIRAGYSAKTAQEQSSRLLSNVMVSEAIRAAIAERSMDADEVLLRLAQMARGDIGDFIDITSMGYSLDLRKAKELGLTHLIKKVKQKTTIFLAKSENAEDREVVETEIELYDAQAALALLGKHHRLFVERTEITGADGGAIPVELFDKTLKKVYGADE